MQLTASMHAFYAGQKSPKSAFQQSIINCLHPACRRIPQHRSFIFSFDLFKKAPNYTNPRIDTVGSPEGAHQTPLDGHLAVARLLGCRNRFDKGQGGYYYPEVGHHHAAVDNLSNLKLSLILDRQISIRNRMYQGLNQYVFSLSN